MPVSRRKKETDNECIQLACNFLDTQSSVTGAQHVSLAAIAQDFDFDYHTLCQCYKGLNQELYISFLWHAIWQEHGRSSRNS